MDSKILCESVESEIANLDTYIFGEIESELCKIFIADNFAINLVDANILPLETLINYVTKFSPFYIDIFPFRFKIIGEIETCVKIKNYTTEPLKFLVATGDSIKHFESVIGQQFWNKINYFLDPNSSLMYTDVVEPVKYYDNDKVKISYNFKPKTLVDASTQTDMTSECELETEIETLPTQSNATFRENLKSADRNLKSNSDSAYQSNSEAAAASTLTSDDENAVQKPPPLNTLIAVSSNNIKRRRRRRRKNRNKHPVNDEWPKEPVPSQHKFYRQEKPLLSHKNRFKDTSFNRWGNWRKSEPDPYFHHHHNQAKQNYFSNKKQYHYYPPTTLKHPKGAPPFPFNQSYWNQPFQSGYYSGWSLPPPNPYLLTQLIMQRLGY